MLTYNNLYKDCGIDQYLSCNFIPYSMIVPVAVDAVELCTPDDGRVCSPKHVE